MASLKHPLRRAVLALAAVGLGYPLHLGCDFNEIDNPSFDLWCGDTLCAWDLDEGTIEQAPTWHKKDLGVAFTSTPTQISQTQLEAQPDCLRFDMVGDVEAEASFRLQLDFNVDGVIEFDQAVPAIHWRSHEFLVHAPERYKGIRYILRKEGGGRAVIGQLRVVSDITCTGPRLPSGPLPPGGQCSENADCSTELCVDGLCRACGEDNDCADGEFCTMGACSECLPNDTTCSEGTSCDWRDDRALPYLSCGEDLGDERGLGENCRTDDDCADGRACTMWNENEPPHCGEACDAVGDACGEGRVCRQFFFFQACEPLAEDGDFCEVGTECASGQCCFNECFDQAVASCG